MKRIALTGGIATGKSHVLEAFRARGIPTLDADQLAHGVTAPGTEGTTAIAQRFGASILDAEGAVDRQKLGAIVFADAGARRDLEAIVHPAVHRAITAGLRALELIGGAPFAIVDVPLLYETHGEADFHKVIATVCEPDIQLERLHARGMTDIEAGQRLAAQMSAAEKAARADYVIRTDGTFADTDAQVDRVLAELLK